MLRIFEVFLIPLQYLATFQQKSHNIAQQNVTIFCSLFLILGLFTRISVIPLIITMCVALFQVHHGDVFGKGETDTLFLTGYFVLNFFQMLLLQFSNRSEISIKFFTFAAHFDFL